MMIVSESEYKVISKKKAFICYCLIFLPVLLLLFISEPGGEVFAYSIIVILAALILIKLYAFKNILLSIKYKQMPPPNTWVLENWNVYKGKEAIKKGYIYALYSIISISAFIYILVKTISTFW